MKNINKGLRLIQCIRIIGLLIVLSAGLFLVSPIAQALEELKVTGKGFLFTIFGVPNSTETNAFGINPSGQIVGRFLDASGDHGFLRDENGNFTTIDDPDSTISFTQAHGINPSGEIVGFFQDVSCPGSPELPCRLHGFLLDKNGNFTTIDVPNSTETEAFGISPSGQIVGEFLDSSSVRHGFLLDTKGNLTIIDVPVPGAHDTNANGISPSGKIVGFFQDSSDRHHGFLLDTKGHFTIIDVPGSTFTEAYGINPSGKIVGAFVDSSGEHGFLRDKKGNFTTIDIPGSTDTEAFGINSSGRIVGRNNVSGVNGFLACPSRISASSLSSGPCS